MGKIKFVLAALVLAITVSCERVAPNYVGVLMENFGKDGKEDFTLVKGRVSTLAPGTELFQVPLWEQRADFEKRVLHLKSADNTEFTAAPLYSYKVIEKRAIDVVFDNKHLGSGTDFMRSLEDNILETKIYDIMKEESRKYTTEQLMAEGGSLKFENATQQVVNDAFEEKGLQMLTFSCQLEFTKEVKNKINQRNEVNTNISVLDQQIAEQRKKNELEELKTQQNLIRARGLTKEIIQMEFIDKWDGKTPLYGSTPVSNLITNK